MVGRYGSAPRGDRWAAFDATSEQQQADAQRIKTEFPNHGKRWSAEHKKLLQRRFGELWDEGMEPPVRWDEVASNQLVSILAAELGRTPGSIHSQLVELRLLSVVLYEREAAIAKRRGAVAEASLRILRGRGDLAARRAKLELLRSQHPGDPFVSGYLAQLESEQALRQFLEEVEHVLTELG
jgi:hypothetical protein